MNFIERNLFIRLRRDHFHTAEETEPMNAYKARCIGRYLQDMEEMPQGEEKMSNVLFNRRLKKIQDNERHAIDTSVETLHLLRLIVRNVNSMLNQGVPLKGIIEEGQYLRTKGDKVDFVKLDDWLGRLHLRRMAQLQGSILMRFFGFQQEELPFVSHAERAAFGLTMRTLHRKAKCADDNWHFRQNEAGFVRNNNKVLRRNLRRSLRYITFAPIETCSNFLGNFAKSLSEIEE